MDIISRGLKVFQFLTIALPSVTEKNSLLSVDVRIQLLQQVYQNEPRVKVKLFDGLLVDWMHESGNSILLRGIRDSVDMANEWRMAHCNKVMNNKIETFFLASSPAVSHISSTLVRQVIACGGDIRPFVPSAVQEYFDR